MALAWLLEVVLQQALTLTVRCAMLAGREDFDVCMLGEGRPFALEVRNARSAPPSKEACQEMQRTINEVRAGRKERTEGEGDQGREACT